MNLNELNQQGAFVHDAKESKPIKWQGKDATVFVRKLSFGRINATQDLQDAERNVMLIQECIRLGDDGSEQLTKEQVESLDPNLAAAFLQAIVDVNKLQDDADPKG